MSKCQCCKREEDLRLGFCWDCANAESIIEEGLDMYDKEVTCQEGMSISMSKLQHILKLYGLTQFKK